MANTTNFNFELIDFDTIPWHTKEHDNWRLADAVFAQYIAIAGIKGIWDNALTIAVADKYVDRELGTIHTALIAHTSASSGTFADDRTANSSFWESFSIDQSFRGTWAAGTSYTVSDFVVDGYQYAVAQTVHTAGDTFAGDSANWIILVDGTAVVTDATTQATASATSATSSASSATSATSAKTAAETAETNAETAQAAAEAAAGAVGAKYTFDNSTTMADPGAGDFRLNNATVGSVSLIAFDATSADTGNPDLSNYIITWDDSSSAINGHVIFKKSGTPATFAIFTVGAVTDNTGWVQVAVTHVTSNGSWSNGDGAFIQFIRNGDAGDLTDVVGDRGSQLGGDLDCNGAQIQWSKGADVASNTALPVLTDGNYFDVTGTTTVTSINTTGGAGTLIKLHFDGAVTLTHHAANLIIAGAANFTTEAGDEIEFVEYDTGKYRMTGWSLAGTAPGGGGGGAFLGEGASGASVGNSGDIIRVNQQILDTSQTMSATDNGSATGPLTIASGVTLTISSGATLAII
jgi:hypothetical protein